MRSWIILAAAATLAACGGGEPPADEAPEARQEAGAFDGLTDTIDRAEAVEQQVLEQKERLDRAIEEAEERPE